MIDVWVLLFLVCNSQECYWVSDSPLNEFPNAFQCMDAGKSRMVHTIMYFDFGCTIRQIPVVR